MADFSPVQSVSKSVELALAGLDPLLIAIGLAFASSTPGPAGEVGAMAAISYDIAHKRWYGVALSAASMIPGFGYIPAFLKIALLLFLLNRRLKSLVLMAPEIHRSPEALELVRAALGKYYYQLPNMRLVRPIRQRLGRIMAFDDCGQLSADSREDNTSPKTSISTQMPK